MKSTESFTSRLELYVIQCDTVIQEIKEIRSLIEDQDYRNAMLKNYAELREALGGSGASSAVAKAMINALK